MPATLGSLSSVMRNDFFPQFLNTGQLAANQFVYKFQQEGWKNQYQLQQQGSPQNLVLPISQISPCITQNMVSAWASEEPISKGTHSQPLQPAVDQLPQRALLPAALSKASGDIEATWSSLIHKMTDLKEWGSFQGQGKKTVCSVLGMLLTQAFKKNTHVMQQPTGLESSGVKDQKNKYFSEHLL